MQWFSDGLSEKWGQTVSLGQLGKKGERNTSRFYGWFLEKRVLVSVSSLEEEE